MDVLTDAGYDVVFEHADGLVWATLIATSNPEAVVPHYGSGATEDEARARAERRWQEEQVGSPADHRQGPRRLP